MAEKQQGEGTPGQVIGYSVVLFKHEIEEPLTSADLADEVEEKAITVPGLSAPRIFRSPSVSIMGLLIEKHILR